MNRESMQRFVEIKRTFLRYFAFFLISAGVAISLYQYSAQGQLELRYSISLSLILAVLGAMFATLFLVMVGRIDREVQQYQPPHESETSGLLHFVFAGERLRFESPHPPEVASSRLKQNVVEAPLWLGYRADAVVGKVRANKVKLMWSLSRIRNSFNPIFIGTFSHCGAGSTLEGVIRLPLLVIAFLSVWFGGLLAFIIAAVVLVLNASGWRMLTSPAAWTIGIFVLAGLAMGGGGIGLVAFGRRISRLSLAKMSEVIRESIS